MKLIQWFKQIIRKFKRGEYDIDDLSAIQDYPQDEDIEDEDEIEIVALSDVQYASLLEIVENYARTNAIALAHMREIKSYVELQEIIATEIMGTVKNLSTVLSETTYQQLIKLYGSQELLEDLLYTRILYYYMTIKYGDFEEKDTET